MAAIELLLTNLFFTYMRPLVEAGKLYRAVTPLYGIKAKGSKETIYCYSEEELENWKNNNKGKSYELSHFKGLGEVDASVLQEICFKNQRFKRLTISDLEKTDELMEVLMGKSVIPRKEFVYENATRLGFNFD